MSGVNPQGGSKRSHFIQKNRSKKNRKSRSSSLLFQPLNDDFETTTSIGRNPPTVTPAATTTTSTDGKTERDSKDYVPINLSHNADEKQRQKKKKKSRRGKSKCSCLKCKGSCFNKNPCGFCSCFNRHGHESDPPPEDDQSKVTVDSSGHYHDGKPSGKCKRFCQFMSYKSNYMFRHPLLRLLTVLVLLVMNALLYVEDPTSYSHSKASLPIFGASYNFAFTNYPDGTLHKEWFVFKIFLVTFLPTLFILLSETVLRRLICQKILNLGFLKGSKGILVFAFSSIIMSLWVGSLIFNDAIEKGGGGEYYKLFFHNTSTDGAEFDYTNPTGTKALNMYKATDRLDISSESFAEVSRTFTFLGDFYTFFSILDGALQDKKCYPRFCRPLKKGKWDMVRVYAFWISTLLVCTYIITYNFYNFTLDISWGRRQAGYTSTGSGINMTTSNQTTLDVNTSSSVQNVFSNIYLNWANIPGELNQRLGLTNLETLSRKDPESLLGLYQCGLSNNTDGDYSSKTTSYSSLHSMKQVTPGSRGLFGMNELGRMIMAAIILILDVLVVVQDVYFPKFDDPSDQDSPKIPGLTSSSIKFPSFTFAEFKSCLYSINCKHACWSSINYLRGCFTCRKVDLCCGCLDKDDGGFMEQSSSDLELWVASSNSTSSSSSVEYREQPILRRQGDRARDKNESVFITARWLTYSVLIMVVIVDLGGLVSHMTYVPEDYGQLVGVDGNIHTIHKDSGDDDHHQTYIYNYLYAMCPNRVKNYRDTYAPPYVMWNKFSKIYNESDGTPLFQYDPHISEKGEYYANGSVHNDTDLYQSLKRVYEGRNKNYYIEYKPAWVGKNVFINDMDRGMSRIDVPINRDDIITESEVQVESIHWDEVVLKGGLNIYEEGKCKTKSLFFANQLRCIIKDGSEGMLLSKKNSTECKETQLPMQSLPCTEMEVNELIVLPKDKAVYTLLEAWKSRILVHLSGSQDGSDHDTTTKHMALLHQYYYFLKDDLLSSPNDGAPATTTTTTIDPCMLRYESNFFNTLDYYAHRGLASGGGGDTNTLLSMKPESMFGERYYLTEKHESCDICEFLKEIGFIFEKKPIGHYEEIMRSHPTNYMDVLEEETRDNTESKDFYIKKRTHSCAITYGPLNIFYDGGNDDVKFILCIIPIAFLILIFLRVIFHYVLESLHTWALKTQGKADRYRKFETRLNDREFRKKNKCDYMKGKCKVCTRKTCNPIKYCMLRCCLCTHCIQEADYYGDDAALDDNYKKSLCSCCCPKDGGGYKYL